MATNFSYLWLGTEKIDMEAIEIDWRDHIHSDPKILLGKPTIKGTRLSVELMLELMAAGWTNEMILESYPTLKQEDLIAVFLYLRECITHELYFPLSKTA